MQQKAAVLGHYSKGAVMAEYATPSEAMNGSEETPEDRLIRDTHQRLKEAQEMVAQFRKQAKLAEMQAEQFERIAKASEAALNVLTPQEKTGSTKSAYAIGEERF